jgi:hypothetical protein
VQVELDGGGGGGGSPGPGTGAGVLDVGWLRRGRVPATNGEGERTREEGASSAVGGRAPWAQPRLYRKGEGETAGHGFKAPLMA